MLKKSLIAIAVLAIALPAFAGDTKIHKPWPTKLVPQQITTIDVVMDVGYYIHIKDQDDIEVTQTSIDGSDPFFTYMGCKTTDVISNFAAVLSGSVAGTSAAGGSWSVTFDKGNGAVDQLNVPSGTTSVSICVTGKDVAIEKLDAQGGADNVKVATLTIWVLPQV